MRYYEARQRTDRRWDYTIAHNDGTCYPTGYCGGFLDPDDTVKSLGYECYSEEQKAEIRSRKDKYHTAGHETAEEAEECYRQYTLDTKTRFGMENSDAQRRCEKCGVWTTKRVMIESLEIVLCDDHQSKETVAELYPKVGTSWVS